jgi:uncharacterized protein (DUF342 family)
MTEQAKPQPTPAAEPPPTLTLKCIPDENKLVAVVPKGKDVLSISPVDLNNLIEAEGYAEWRINPSALTEACKLMGTLEEEREVLIAECLDGEFSLTVSDDALKAFLSITPPAGGAAVSESQIAAALKENEISQDIRKKAVRAAVASRSADKTLIASGTPPEHGVDSVFESLIPEAKDSRPKINEDGSVDYHEIGAFITVNAGDKLMRKLPPTSGTNGVDVHGKVLPATPGNDLKFAAGVSGVEVDPENDNVLIAAIGGQPEMVEHGAIVHPVINVKDAGIETGNIDFDGTVNIAGDVSEGIKIRATGDILIAGMTEGAVLHADGNITIQKGVIGRGEVRNEKGEPGAGTAQLTSGGSIEARFIENALVQAAENVTVGELVSHSEIVANQHVLVGKKGAKKGHILGGKVQAAMDVSAQVIGSQANVHTHIQVGANPELHKKLTRLKTEHEEMSEEMVKLSTLITRIRKQTDDKSKEILLRAVSTLQELKSNLKKNSEQQELLAAQDELSSEAKVKVGKHAFPGVTIEICDNTKTVQDRTEAGEFFLDGDSVQFKLV